jgi:tetratricopeptide (TPR) repeat protein
MSLDLRKYYQYLGFTYKLVPLREAPGKQNVAINTDELYDKMMNVYRWGNMNKKGIFVDYNNSYTLSLALNVRGMHARLADDLMNKGRNKEAVAILDSAMVRMPACNFPLNISSVQNDVEIMNIIQLYYRLDQFDKVDALAEEFVALTEKNLAFFSTLHDASYDLEMNLAYMQQMGTVLAPYNEELSTRVKQQLDFYLAKLGHAK